jgi:hypothetical protein
MAINFENRYTDVSGSDELHLSDYLRTIVRGWRTIVMVTLIALALGCAYAFLAPPTYRADVLFHVEDKTANANANGKDSLPPLTAEVAARHRGNGQEPAPRHYGWAAHPAVHRRDDRGAGERAMGLQVAVVHQPVGLRMG